MTPRFWLSRKSRRLEHNQYHGLLLLLARNFSAIPENFERTLANAFSALADAGKRVIDRAWFRFAFVLVKIRLQLLSGFLAVQQKFLPRAERQTANITISDTRGGPDKSHDLKASFCHIRIVSNSAGASGYLAHLQLFIIIRLITRSERSCSSSLSSRTYGPRSHTCRPAPD